MKKAVSALLTLTAALSALIIPAAPARAEGIQTSAFAYVLYCVNNGEVLLSCNSDRRLPMASTTKIMTALLTLEEAERDNRVITFTDEMTAEGSSMYLQVGERLTLRDLAIGMLMQSGNDAANAAAIAVGGSFEGFAELMNSKAEELGMENTHFVTPSGLDDEEHYSTAYDMALLLSAAMENELFAEITGQTSMTVTFADPSDKVVTYPNHNKLLKLCDGCIGGKTGYTDSAGRCLITCAERDGLRLVVSTLCDGDDWNDHTALYEYGFDRYAVYSPDELTQYTVDVVGGVADSAAVYAAETDGIVIPREGGDEINAEVYLPRFLYAPIARNTEVGSIIYSTEEKRLAEVTLYTADNVKYNDRRRGLTEYIKDILNWHS